MTAKQHSLALMITLFAAPLFAEHNFYIAPSGNDAASGSLNAPWKTLNGARGKIAQHRDKIKEPVVINLREGIYTQNATLHFNETDIPVPGMTIRAYNDENVIISGGRSIQGWQRHNGSTWKTRLERDEPLRQLYVDGGRARLAGTDFPIQAEGFFGTHHINSSEPWALDSGSGPLGLLFKADGTIPDLTKATQLEVRYLHEGWRQYIVPITKVEVDGKQLKATMAQPIGATAGSYWNSTMSGTGYYQLVNAIELLDSPGEFFFDQSASILYYYAQPGQDMQHSHVFVPQLEKLLTISGKNMKKRVANLTLEGLTFAHTGWNLAEFGDSRGWISPQSVVRHEFYNDRMHNRDKDQERMELYEDTNLQLAAVEISSADAVKIDRCTFRQLGAIGVRFVNDVVNSELTRNRFFDTGSAAITIGHPHHRTLNGGRLFPKGIEGLCEKNTIADNLIRYVGTEIHMAPAISVFFVADTVITRNHLNFVPYSGISFGWDWSNAWNIAPEDLDFDKAYGHMSQVMHSNEISYNFIDNFNYKFKDGGAIYTLGLQANDSDDPVNMPSSWSILAHNYLGTGRGMGHYLDEGSRFWSVSNSIASGGAWLVLNPGSRDVIANHIYTGIGFEAGVKSNPIINLTVTNINHQAWGHPFIDGPPEVREIYSQAGVDPTLRERIVPHPENLALKKTVTLSSLASGNPDATVNGNPGDFFHRPTTKAGPNAWWQVDLGQVEHIDQVIPYGPFYGANEHTVKVRDFYLFISDEPFSSDDPAKLKKDPDVWHFFYSGILLDRTAAEHGAFQRMDCIDVNNEGRYVRIQLTGTDSLSLNEVEVMNFNLPPIIR